MDPRKSSDCLGSSTHLAMFRMSEHMGYEGYVRS